MEREIRNMFEGLLRRIRRDEKPRQAPGARSPLSLDGPAPDFEAASTHGPIRLSTWNQAKWVVLFSHPADFTPVCTTEFMELSRRYDEFRRRGVALLGSSVDSLYAHIAWVRNIKDKFGIEIQFPVIADLDMRVSRLYGMIHEPTSDTSPVRAMFFLDPDRRLRAMIYYPLNVGRNVSEVLRVLDALQMADEQGLAAPAGWEPGEPAVLPPPRTASEAEERVHAEDLEVHDWYFSKKTPKAA